MKKFLFFFLLFDIQLAVAQNLTGNSLALYMDPGSDQAQSLTEVSLSNRGQNGSSYRWSLYTAAIGGGYGVRPNAFEIWEYPPQANSNLGCCLQRLSIAPASIANYHPVIVDGQGGLSLGGYYSAGSNLLSVNGNVGIGTQDTKGYALGVNGTIHSQAVKVDMTGWSDYVFNPEYNLSTLEQIKAFVDKNHHLPDMPAEKEVVKNGIDLGQMINLQQKKIEELTLYLIAKDKKDQAIAQELTALKKQVKYLQHERRK